MKNDEPLQPVPPQLIILLATLATLVVE